MYLPHFTVALIFSFCFIFVIKETAPRINLSARRGKMWHAVHQPSHEMFLLATGNVKDVSIWERMLLEILRNKMPRCWCKHKWGNVKTSIRGQETQSFLFCRIRHKRWLIFLSSREFLWVVMTSARTAPETRYVRLAWPITNSFYWWILMDHRIWSVSFILAGLTDARGMKRRRRAKQAFLLVFGFPWCYHWHLKLKQSTRSSFITDYGAPWSSPATRGTTLTLFWCLSVKALFPLLNLTWCRCELCCWYVHFT